MLDVPIDEIRPNPNQPRKVFEAGALDELAASIRTAGLLQPVIARRASGGYELIAGERRWRAARQAGLDRIPVIVRDATDAESLELALIENLLREDLNPIEEAEAYQKLLAQFDWTQEELSQKIGKDRSSIANSLRLLRLPEGIQEDLKAGRLTMGHARALLALSLPSEQIRLRDEILAHTWSVRETEENVSRRRTAPAPRRRRSIELADLEAVLQRTLMTRVKIVGHDRRGKIEITYATSEELERITSVLTQGRGA
jgi:ParB family chromosome partitioning protein